MTFKCDPVTQKRHLLPSSVSNKARIRLIGSLLNSSLSNTNLPAPLFIGSSDDYITSTFQLNVNSQQLHSSIRLSIKLQTNFKCHSGDAKYCSKRLWPPWQERWLLNHDIYRAAKGYANVKHFAKTMYHLHTMPTWCQMALLLSRTTFYDKQLNYVLQHNQT